MHRRITARCSAATVVGYFAAPTTVSGTSFAEVTAQSLVSSPRHLDLCLDPHRCPHHSDPYCVGSISASTARPPSPAAAIESGNTEGREGRGGATEGERGEAERGVAFGGEACGHVEEEERPVWHCAWGKEGIG